MENLQTAKDIPGLVGTDADESILTPQALATLPPTDMHYLGNGIPKLLHATWKTRKLTEVHSKFLASWQRCLPQDWKIVLWADDDVDAFMHSDQVPDFFKDTFWGYRNRIQRIDSFRYVLLNVWGGVYMDLDNECLSDPLWPRIDECQVYLAEQPSAELGQQIRYVEEVKQFMEKSRVLHWPIPPPVQNSLMASPPGHRFWHAVLHFAVERRFAGFDTGKRHTMKSTGPDFISIANHMFGAGNDTSVCVLSQVDWHGPAGGSKSDGSEPLPRFVWHHGTHTWSEKAISTWSRYMHFLGR